MDTIKAGHQRLKFAGITKPLVDTTNIYYSLYADQFECYTLDGRKVPVYGLPISVVEWYMKGSN